MVAKNQVIAYAYRRAWHTIRKSSVLKQSCSLLRWNYSDVGRGDLLHISAR